MSIYELDLREQNIYTQSKLSHVGHLDTFGHIRRDKYTINKSFNRDKNVSEHISDQELRTANLVTKLKLSRNNSDLSSYNSSILSLARIPEQIVNSLHGQTLCRQYDVSPKIHSAENVHRVNSYSDSVKTSSVQSQNHRYSEAQEKQYNTHVPRKFYGQVTYNVKKTS